MRRRHLPPLKHPSEPIPARRPTPSYPDPPVLRALGRDRFRLSALGEGPADDWLGCLPRHPASRRRRHLPLHLHPHLRLLPARQTALPPAPDQGRGGARERLDGRRARHAVLRRQLPHKLRPRAARQNQPHLTSQDRHAPVQAQAA